MKTVHLIFNAHLDPVWLWPWSAGLDEILNTCTSVCDLLDRHPDLVFTRGEAWVYEQIERMAPPLFRRIVRHVRAGQWELAGGWYVQPDCNLPGRGGFEKQIELGRGYFRSRFGTFPRIAYNVDSFGHAASLPDIMAAQGQSHYVMMRPQAHEMPLPARLFHWQGVGGARVKTFRIAPEYCTPEGITWQHIEASLTNLPPGVDHTMCFVGVGDHGGGPTEALVQWCRENARSRPGIQLILSSPARFFRAVEKTKDSWPVVTGELQQHAIGCYSVHRRVKTMLRHAERLLDQADRAVQADRALRKASTANRRQAWAWTCFSAFHDTLGGTCLPSAYAQIDGQLGTANCTADEVLSIRLRRIMAQLPGDPCQRIVLANFSDRPFDDFIEHEPWLEWTAWRPDWVLIDEQGRVVPSQQLESEALRENTVRLAFRLAVAAGDVRVLRIVRQDGWSPAAPAKYSRLTLGRRGALAGRGPAGAVLMPRLILRGDPTDTWSHGIDRFDGNVVASATWTKPRRIETGGLMETWQVTGTIAQSPLLAEWRFFAREPFHELHLKVDWREEHRVLQLLMPVPEKILGHTDGIPGAMLNRPVDGKERPIRDFILLRLAGGGRLGVACPEVFSASVRPAGAALTLLRSCVMAHHEPNDPRAARRQFSDRGAHEMKFRFFQGKTLAVSRLEAAAAAMSDVIRRGDLTVGMPLRALRGQVQPGHWHPQPGVVDRVKKAPRRKA